MQAQPTEPTVFTNAVDFGIQEVHYDPRKSDTKLDFLDENNKDNESQNDEVNDQNI